MNDRSLFAPPPRAKRGVILTLAGSLLFHGSLVGVAALWATRPAEEPPRFLPVEIDQGWPNEPRLPELPAPAESEPEAPVMRAVEPATDQPTIVDPDADDMTLATPTPRPATRATMPPRSRTPSATAIPSVSRVPGGGPANATAGTGPGAGRAGARWNVSTPVYPAALRLARVQGSGTVRVTTDASGHVASAVIVQSTGSLALDDLTCQTAKGRWSGPPNATTMVPITYQLR